MEILSNFALQLLFTVGVVVVFGLPIALCRRAFCRIVGRAGPGILLATGIVGTPVHELSHAAMCLLFGHRIDEIKLFTLHGDGTLGYVKHSYNTRNLYHRIGNFFIGVSPILGGSAVLLLLFRLMLPEAFSVAASALTAPVSSMLAGAYLSRFFGILGAVFSAEHLANPMWWLFLLLALMIAGHMEISTADLRSGISGFSFIAVLLLALDAILYVVSPAVLTSLTNLCLGFSTVMVGFLAVSGVFSLLLVLVAGLIRLITNPLRRG